jgi:hypothetical protein
MRLDILAQVLVDAGLGTIGTDIFMHRMDANAVRGILLRNPIDGVAVDPTLPKYYKSALQAIVREETQAAGDAKAAAIIAALTFYNREFRAPTAPFALIMQVKQLYPTKLPIIYPRSVGRGIEWSCNFHADYVLR